jgi:glycosyltransferase involved in cell wall biosynthesis
VYIQPNRGGANARNRGIELSQGKYIIFMDADDIVEKDFIKK